MWLQPRDIFKPLAHNLGNTLATEGQMQKMHDAIAGNKRARAESEREIRYALWTCSVDLAVD